MSTALLIVDVQNDFAEGGALGVTGGDAIAAGVTALLAGGRDAYVLVVASRDWHDGDSDNGGHFASSTPDFQMTWPVHCVADTHGAAYHPAFDTTGVDVHVRKGQGVPAYSAFEGTVVDGTTLAEVLHDHHVDSIDIAGLATDFCVRASALDALAAGFSVRVMSGLVAGVSEAGSRAALDEIVAAGGEVGSPGTQST